MTKVAYNCHPIATRGIWFGENPLDAPFPRLMVQISLIVLTSRLLYYFLKPVGQTKAACNLLAGIILGPSVLGKSKLFSSQVYTKNDQLPIMQTMSLMGVIYDIFLTIVKFDPFLFKRTAKNSWKIGSSFLIPSLLIVYPLTQVNAGFNNKCNIYMKLATTFSLSMSYYPVITEALYELNLMTSELGQLAMSSTMLNYAVLWLLVIADSTVFIDGITVVLSGVGLLLFTLYVLRPLVLLIVKNTAEGEAVKEVYIVAILLGVLVMAFLTEILAARYTLAPLLLGLIIPDGPPLGASLAAKTELLVSEVLLPVYYFRLGTGINLFLIDDWTKFAKIEAFILLLFVTKIAGVTLVGLWCKLSLKNSFILSMIMSMKGIVELLIYNRWRSLKIIEEQFFNQLIMSTLVLTMIVTPVVRFLYTPQRRLRKSTKGSHVRDIQSLPNNTGTLQIVCCVHNEDSARSIITLLEASNPTEASPISTSIVYAVDLNGSYAAQLKPYRKKKMKLLRLDSPGHQLMRAFENYTKNSRGPVMVNPYTMVAPYKSMHETILRLAQDKLAPLIIIPFPDNHVQSIAGAAPNSPVRQVIMNLQAFSQCTVGILVDKGLPYRASVSTFSYIVAVFFIGGPDDREALAYASRMADNPDVGITVFRILVRINKLETGEEDEREFKLDESLLDEFKLRNTGNDWLNWRDIEVDDGVEVVKAIKNLQGEYDLVMVGRRQSDVSLRDEEMANLLHTPELGVIGDMLASSDFCDGMVNVMVMQEGRSFRA